MPPKRTHSAAQEPNGDSSNVTDYLGPYESKRRQRGNQNASSSAAWAEESSGRVTRAAAAAFNQHVEPQQKAPPARRQTRGRHVNPAQDDDDDESVNVDFPQISSAVNEARQGRPRTINGLRTVESRKEGPSGTAASQDPEAESEDSGEELEDQRDEEGQGEDTEVQPSPEVSKPSRGRGRPPSKPGRHAQPKQQSRPGIRPQTVSGASRNNLYEFEPEPTAQAPGTQQRRATRSGAMERQEAPQRQVRRARLRNQDKTSATQEHVAPVRNDEHDDEASSSEEPVLQNDRANAAKDSAFIDAPQPGQNVKLQEVEATINSLGGIITTLKHPAWTGLAKWARGFEARCKSSTGRALMGPVDELHDVLVEAIDVRNGVDSDQEAHEATIAYLRDNSGKVERNFAGITELVGKICTEELAPGEDLAGRPVKARKRLLRDIAKCLIPMFVLLVEKACDLVPSTPARGKVHLILNSFTFQFPLRTIGWADRLEQALTRGLEHWPIDKEFTKEGELNDDEVDLKHGKMEARAVFRKQLRALSSSVKEAARAMPELTRQATPKKYQDQELRKKLIQQRELWDAEQRRELEASQRSAERWAAFCHSTQALNYAPNPLKLKWDQAERARLGLEARLVTVSNEAPRGRARVPQRARFDDHDPFVIHDNEDPFTSKPAQSTQSAGQEKGNPTSDHGARLSQDRPATASHTWNGLDWTKEEEKILIDSIRYFEDYNIGHMADRLKRSRIDVANKAALFKAKYRQIYAERGVEIPEWAL